MKNTIKILTWINRIFMIPFTIYLLLGIVDSQLLFYAAYIAFVLGIYQLLSFLVTLLCFSKITNQRKKTLIIYLLSVLFFFLICFLIASNNFNNRFSIIIYSIYIIPVSLSLFWTFILESINKEL
ncbi:MAG: hypothetical protein ACJA1B_001545 [Polaribacter sp.]|jgi:hypothetical protein